MQYHAETYYADFLCRLSEAPRRADAKALSRRLHHQPRYLTHGRGNHRHRRRDRHRGCDRAAAQHRRKCMGACARFLVGLHTQHARRPRPPRLSRLAEAVIGLKAASTSTPGRMPHGRVDRIRLRERYDKNVDPSGCSTTPASAALRATSGARAKPRSRPASSATASASDGAVETRSTSPSTG